MFWLPRLRGERWLALSLLFLSAYCCGQTTDSQALPTPQPIDKQKLSDLSQQSGTQDLPKPVRPTISSGDEGDLTITGVPEFSLPDMNVHFVVNSAGEIWTPLLGKVLVAGLTLENAQELIENRLQNEGYLKDPHVTIVMKDFLSDRVLIVGEVTKPGAYPTRGAPRLFDLFNAAGGLTAKAGSRVIITHSDPTQGPDYITLGNDPVSLTRNDILLHTGDTVTVSRAGIVYVLGEVNRAGGFVMENETLTTVEAIALAAGPTHLASMSHVQLVRRTPTGLDNKILDVNKILKAKKPDFALQAEDILFVPSSKSKVAAQMSAPSLLNMIGALVIYHF